MDATQKQISLIQDLANRLGKDAKKDYLSPMGIEEPDKPTAEQASKIIQEQLKEIKRFASLTYDS